MIEQTTQSAEEAALHATGSAYHARSAARDAERSLDHFDPYALASGYAAAMADTCARAAAHSAARAKDQREDSRLHIDLAHYHAAQAEEAARVAAHMLAAYNRGDGAHLSHIARA